MYRRGDSSLLKENLVYLILTGLFLLLIFLFVSSYGDGAANMESMYAQELVHLINTAPMGAEIVLDVTPLTAIAVRRGKDPREIVSFDNIHNTVTVSLRRGTGSLFTFVRNVDVVGGSPLIELVSAGAEINRLRFTIKPGRSLEAAI
jgi:hypothetical protein